MKILLPIIFTLLCNSIFAQIQTDTLFMQTGDSVKLPINFDKKSINNGEFRLIGQFTISNTSVFYPLKFNTPNGQINSNITKINDSVYKFNINLSQIDTSKYNGIGFYLSGLALAGNDTICLINFNISDPNLDTIATFTTTLISKSYNLNINYIRFPTIDQFNPNILANNQSMGITFHFDNESEVLLYIMDLKGRFYLLKNYGTVQRGDYIYNFIPTDIFESGIYYVVLKSNHGSANRKFMIVK